MTFQWVLIESNTKNPEGMLLKFEGDIVYFISDIIVSADVSLEKLQ